MTRARDLADGIFEQATGGVLKLETSDTTVTDGSVLGKIEFKAPDEASGTDAILVGAAIEAVAEGTFAADNNATELVFKTGASAAADTKMVITSGGNVGIGVTTPLSPLHVEGTNSATSVITVGNSDTSIVSSDTYGTYNFFANDATSNSKGGVGHISVMPFGTSDDGSTPSVMKFFTHPNSANDASLLGNAVEVMQLDSSGNVTVKTGNLVIGTDGKGIDFSAQTQSAATTTSELLDHYEEGTWTPTLAAGTVSVNNTSTFTKIGRLVTCQVDITYPSQTNANDADVFGLPFTSANSVAEPGGAVFTDFHVSNNVDGFTAKNTTRFRLQDGAGTSITLTAMAGKVLRATIIYITAT